VHILNLSAKYGVLLYSREHVWTLKHHPSNSFYLNSPISIQSKLIFLTCWLPIIKPHKSLLSFFFLGLFELGRVSFFCSALIWQMVIQGRDRENSSIPRKGSFDHHSIFSLHHLIKREHQLPFDFLFSHWTRHLCPALSSILSLSFFTLF
jgi:hypothetical protein